MKQKHLSNLGFIYPQNTIESWQRTNVCMNHMIRVYMLICSIARSSLTFFGPTGLLSPTEKVSRWYNTLRQKSK